MQYWQRNLNHLSRVMLYSGFYPMIFGFMKAGVALIGMPTFLCLQMNSSILNDKRLVLHRNTDSVNNALSPNRPPNALPGLSRLKSL